MLVLVLGLRTLGMGPSPIGRRLPTWGVSSHQAMVGIPMQP